ncbi:MAG: hypothetical protein ACYTGC_18260, partial [Planctomycetota bacterium]
ACDDPRAPPARDLDRRRSGPVAGTGQGTAPEAAIGRSDTAIELSDARDRATTRRAPRTRTTASSPGPAYYSDHHEPDHRDRRRSGD